jgi:hypothetical protein
LVIMVIAHSALIAAAIRGDCGREWCVTCRHGRW